MVIGIFSPWFSDFGVVCFVLWSNWICFILWYGFLYIYIFHCINLMIIETIQEVDVTGVHRSTL